MRSKKFLSIIVLFAFTITISAQQTSYTFNTAGATGSLGPTQSMVNFTYTGTSLAGSVAVINGIQSFTIPNTGLYSIESFGASGGNRTNSPQRSGGLGAYVRGEFNLTQGDVLTILVGQKGVDGLNTASGGGGTYILNNNVLLVASGAGGGATGDNNGGSAVLTTSGANDFPGGLIPGGSGGNGGLVCNSSGANHGGAGAGYLGNGATSILNNAAGGGLAFVNGGVGGVSTVPGAFGGGGGATASGVGLYGGGGGGGGYSGGAGGQQINHCTPGINRSGGGGGGSYNTGSSPTSSLLTTQGNARVILTSLCNVGISASSNPICKGDALLLSTTAASNILWSTGATTGSISVSPSVTTTYSVIGTSTANCIASSVISIVVNSLPNISAVVQPTTLCVGNTATVTAAGAATFSWSNTQSGQSIFVNPNSTTTYSIVGTSTAGCMSTGTVSVNVNTNSLIVTNGLACIGQTMQLNASGANTYTWSNGSLFPLVNVIASAVNNYTVSGTDNHSCILTKVVSIAGTPNPTISVSSNPLFICKGETIILTASGANTYTWNNSVISNSISLTPKTNVIYQHTVTGVDNNGCLSSKIYSLSANACTGIEESATENIYKIYPNPSTGKLTLQTNDYSVKQISIYDHSAKLIKTLLSEQSQIIFSIEDLPAGLYFIRVEGREESSFRVIKE